MHTPFAHQQHDYSDVDHAHVVRVDTPTETFRYIARSVKQNRDCTCVRGDFDCKCLSTAGLHEHVFFHEHDDAGIYHQHTVRVESPPIGLPMRSPTVSRFDDQIFSFYGAGANDELPEDFFEAVQDISAVEDQLIGSRGTTVELPLTQMPGNIPAGSSLRIVIDESAQILVLQSKGETGIHYVQTVKDSLAAPCGRLARLCGGVLDRALNVPSLPIGAARFRDYGCFPSTLDVGSQGFMTVRVTLKNPIPKDGMLSVSLPEDLTFSGTPEITFVNGTAEAHTEVYDQTGSDFRCQEAPGLPCVIVRMDQEIESGRALAFTLSNLVLPSFSTELASVAQNLGVCRAFSMEDSDDGIVVIDETPPIIIAPAIPGTLDGVSVEASSNEAAAAVTMTVEFRTRLPLVNGTIVVSFPNVYDVHSATVNVLIPNDEAYTFSIDGSALELQLLRDLSTNEVVRFVISGVENGPTPGLAGVIRVETRIPGDTTSEVGVVERKDVAMPELTPTVLRSSKVAMPESQQKTGASGALNVSFVTPIPIVPGSEIVLSLPDGFSPCQPDITVDDVNVSGIIFAELFGPKYCRMEACNGVCNSSELLQCSDVHSTLVPVSGKSIRIFVNESCPIDKDSEVLIRVRNMVNSLTYAHQVVPFALTVENDGCGAAKICSKDDGISTLYIEYNELKDFTVFLPYTTAGIPPQDFDGAPARFSFHTTNPMPLDGRVGLDVPMHFVVPGNVAVSVAINNGPVTAASQKAVFGNFIYFTIESGLQAGDRVEFNVTGIINRDTVGTVYFKARNVQLQLAVCGSWIRGSHDHFAGAPSSSL